MTHNLPHFGRFSLLDDTQKSLQAYRRATQLDPENGDGWNKNVYSTRGDLDKAIESYNKALEIDESLGRKEGMANQYANLGLLYDSHKDYKKARAYWEKSLPLYQALGSPNAQKMQVWLDGLPR